MATGQDHVAAVFGLLCRLTGNAREAERLAAVTYATAMRAGDLRALLDTARQVYLAEAGPPVSNSANEIDALTPHERVEREASHPDSDDELWRSRDAWLDDDTRYRIRRAVESGDVQPLPPTGVSSTFSAPGAHIPDRSRSMQRSSRRATKSVQQRGVTPRRAAMVVTGVVVAALLGVAALLVAPDRKPSTSSEASTSVVTTTPRSSSTSVESVVTTRPPLEPAASGDQGYILDEMPDGYVFDGAHSSPPFSIPGWMRVWASADAARAGGRWIAAALHADTDWDCCRLQVGDARVDLGGTPGLVTVLDDGPVEVRFESAEGGMQLRTYGLSLPELIDAASRLARGEVDSVLPDLDLLFADAGWGLLDRYFDSTFHDSVLYRAADGSSWFSISVQNAGEADLRLADLLLGSPDVGSGVGRWVSVSDRKFLVARDTFGESMTAIIFAENADTVVVRGTAPIDTMLAAAASARRATAAEWLAAVNRQPLQVPLAHEPSPPRGRFFTIGDPAEGIDYRWRVRLSDEPRLVEVGALGPRPYVETFTLDGPLFTLTALDATIVVVATSDVGSAVAARFTPQGVAPVEVALTQVGNTSLYGAAFAYSEFVPCVIELVDSSGTVVATLSD